MSDLDMRIVAVSEDNFDDLLPLVAAYQKFYQMKNIEPERNRRFFGRFLSKPEDGVQFLCYLDDRAVGFTTLYFPFSSTRASRFALMNDLYVDNDLRGKGIGKALIEKAREVAAARGFSDLCWMTAEDNQRAQRLYDRLPVDKSKWFEYSLPAAKG